MIFENLPKGTFRAIALIYWTVITPIMPLWFPNNNPEIAYKISNTTGIVLTALGFGRAFANKEKDKTQVSKVGK